MRSSAAFAQRSRQPFGVTSITCLNSWPSIWAGPFAVRVLFAGDLNGNGAVQIAGSATEVAVRITSASSTRALFALSLEVSPQSLDMCMEQRTCPVANLSHVGDVFVPAKCGEPCGEEEDRCMMVRPGTVYSLQLPLRVEGGCSAWRQGYVLRDADRVLGGPEGCKSTCIKSTQDSRP